MTSVPAAGMAPQAVAEPREGSSSRGSSHYRRDYEQAGSGSAGMESFPENPVSPRQEIQRKQAAINRPPPPPIRLVTILIEDVRGAEPDSLLAEVRVGLRDSENPAEDGFWANADEICKTLQSSPSRIDGPAKVYALRGKYRQIILRVSADNEDEWVTANVVVSPDRTLDVVVEPGAPARAPPPRKARKAVAEPDPYPSPRAMSQYPYGGSPAQPEKGRKRRHSGASDDYRPGPSSRRQWSPSTLHSSSPRATPSHVATTSHQSITTTSPDPWRAFMHPPPPQIQKLLSPQYAADMHHARASSDSSESGDSDDVRARAAVQVEQVDGLLQTEPEWSAYFRAYGQAAHGAGDAGLNTASCRASWTSGRASTRPPGGSLTASHIAAALHIKDEPEKYMAHCAETLRLLALYGPEGRRVQHPEVVQAGHGR
ncbi:hypothetical protein C8J57DRAFT_585906 [Mycena rebaudengoi]|nr:hypothetical protein C8J57DRAFT_585906 [Mycena rebaudengoi]